MSRSDSDMILPSSQELNKAVEDEEKKRVLDSDSLHSDDDSGKENKLTKKMQRSGVLMMVNETEKEFKYRNKQFKDHDAVVTNRKLRCTACCSSLQSVVLEGRDVFHHPVLKVLMCKTCIGFYGDGDFSMDEDGSDKYCRWCGQGGTLYCCSLCCCAFCKKCIKRNLSRTVLVDIESEEWKCFVCDGVPLWELRAICANAQTVSKKMRRKIRETNERNLKQLQKKGPPGTPKGRRHNRWQNNAAVTSSSSEKETRASESSSEERPKCRKSKRPPSRNKRKRDSSSSSSNRRKNDNKKKIKEEHSDSDVAVIETEKECIVLTDTEDDTHGSAKNNKSVLKKTSSSSKKGSEDDKMPEEIDPEGVKEAQDLLQEHLEDLVHTGELIAYRAKRLLEKKIDEKAMSDPKKVDKVVESINLLVKLSGENMQHTLDFLNSRHKHFVKGVKRKYKHSKLNAKPKDTNSVKVSQDEQEKEKNRETEDIVTKVDEENVHLNGVINVKVENSDENDKPTCEEHSDTENNNEELPLKECEMEHGKNKETENDSSLNSVKVNEAAEETNLLSKSSKRKKRNDSSEEMLDEHNSVGKEEQGKKKQKKTLINDNSDEDIFLDKDNEETVSNGSCNEGMGKHSNSESDQDVTSEKNCTEHDKGLCEKSEEENSNTLQKSAVHNELESSSVSFTSLATLKIDQNEPSDLCNSLFSDDIVKEEKSNVKDKDDDSSDAATVELLNSPDPSSDKSELVEILTDLKAGKEDSCSKSEEVSAGVQEQNIVDSDPLSVNTDLKESEATETITKRVINDSCDSDDEDSNLEASGHNKASDLVKDKASDIENLQLSGDDSETNKSEDGENKEIKKSEDYSDDCLEAQKALLGYTSDDEDEDKPKKKLRKKGQKKTKTDEESKVEKNPTKNLKKRRIGPKSKTRQFRSSSSSSATDEESDESSSTKQTKHENGKKKKFKLKDTDAYKQDKKLGCKCNVEVKKLTEDEFQKYYENYYINESSKSEEETRDDKEIRSLINLKSLKKGTGKNSQDNSNESETEEFDDSLKKKKKKPKKDKAKDQEQRLLDFFNKEDDEVPTHDMSPSPNQSDGGEDITKPEMKKKALVEKQNEMAMELLLRSSSSEDEVLRGSQDETPEEEEKKKKKSKEKEEVKNSASDASIDEKDADSKKTEEMEEEKEEEEQKENEGKVEEPVEMAHEEEEKGDNKEEKDDEDENKDEKEEEEDNKEKKEEDGDENKDDDGKKDDDQKKDNEKKDDNGKENEEKDEKKTEIEKDDSSDSEIEAPKKKNWRKDKLLTEKLTDIDTSDEERLWKTKKEKEKKMEDFNSDEKSSLVKKKSKKKAKRRILGSDDEVEELKPSSSDSPTSSDSDIFVTKKKKKKKKSDSDEMSSNASDSDSDFKSKKPKRRRIKAPASDSSSNDEDSPHKSTPGKGRKKIHHILSDDNVAEATRKAAKEEEERRKRIAEKQKMYNEMYKQVEGVEKLAKLVLDFDPESKKELVSVDTSLVHKLKPHQAKGVKFMWDACFESLKEIKKTKGSGCILAHCMGLGKTFQIVTLVHTLLNHKDTEVNTVLVVCPLSTVLNWVNEFNMWLKDGEEVNVFELSKYKQNYERMYQLKDWQESGGVLVIGYDMYRNLTNPQAKRLRKKAIETFQSSLVDPGPDLVVCDEGHLLKNEDSAIAKAMRRIRTLRRIVLTGTPLQNNLKEYHCMVQFVKPNLLGTRKEFLNRFVNPITNGQFEDSTLHDVKIMKRRAHVLHKMLEGSVQRFDYSVLTPFLPPKHEYVIFVRLTEFQVKAYRYYLDFISKRATENKGAQLFTDFQNLQRIFTHPRVLMMSSKRQEKEKEKKRLMESDSEGSLREFIDDDDDDDETPESSSSDENSSDDKGDSDVQIVDRKKEDKPSKSSKTTRNTRSRGLPEEPEVQEVDKEDGKENPEAWWKQFIQEEDTFENINYSGKLVLLFTILRECEKIGDKVLIFSQSLFSLDLIEYFLGQIDAATQNEENKDELGNNSGSWSLGLDYFRIDGSTSLDNRNIWCKTFNREENHRARLFIISTRAGGLGINLFAANRVILFDASWNPSHDVQSIFRVYRFGQKKPCYIYRFLAQGTMEEKIYDRQVTKLSLSCRVVDEQQIERHYNMADLQELYQFDPEQKTKRPTPILPKDRLLAELLKEHEQWIVTYHEHDSLLENKEEEELNEEERNAAWEEYENEKQGKTIQTLPATLPPGGQLNLVALREALRHDNPLSTEEQLEQKLSLIIGQISDYLKQNGAPNQATATQLQAIQQYQLQQQMRAQYMENQKKQQENSLRAAAKTFAGYNPHSYSTVQQYLQDQKNTYVGPSYPTNLYRNSNVVDKSGVFRMQQKLVPITPWSPGAPMMLQNYANQNPSSSLQPVNLSFPIQPAHGSGTLGVYRAGETSKKDTSKKPVPDDHIETVE